MTVVLLETESNARGDLFGRLMADLFHTLGYGACRFNIHKSGREIDLVGEHRVEPRAVLAECKATADPVGGSDVNKFVGVLDAERRRQPDVDMTGYIVSLSGFTETALQQEIDVGSRVVLLKGSDVLSQLVTGRIVVDRATAATSAASCLSKPQQLHPEVELLALNEGWTWVIYFGLASERPTHVVFVHADGTPLSTSSAQAIAKRAQTRYEHMIVAGRATLASTETVAEAYRTFINLTCGEITLDGMPADEYVGSRRLRLETLYVPMSVTPLSLRTDESRGPVDESGFGLGTEREERESLTIGTALRARRKISLLGGPGAGKSTVIKRLATAYADATRKGAVSDGLPDERLVPIVVRCRELPAGSFTGFHDVIGMIAGQLENPDIESATVAYLVAAAREGRALLLIDGLDEIPDSAVRQQFVSQLRVFAATYPSIRLVVTSREVGFRVVAGAIDSVCERFAVAELTDDDIRMLTLAWYRETAGATSSTAASVVANEILSVDRVRRLARNPLLLTILLLVRRWAGQVPRRRTVLYAKAIDVLLATWNVEGHEPLDSDESLPQLAYVAFCMMQLGLQSVSASQLTEILTQSRNQMPELVAYARMGVTEFIQRVEERSSLLNLSGHSVEDGVLEPTYEFKHLTFQEYLAAIAAVRGWHPRRLRSKSVETTLRPYLGQESWREVVPLAAALAGSAAGSLVTRLSNMVPPQSYPNLGVRSARSHPDRVPVMKSCLVQCLVDEVQIAPEVVRGAIRALVESVGGIGDERVGILLSGRFGGEVYDVIDRGYEAGGEHRPAYGSALASVQVASADQQDSYRRRIARCRKRIEGGSSREARDAALEMMVYAFQSRVARRGKGGSNVGKGRPLTRSSARMVANELIERLRSDPDPSWRFAGLWAFAWLADSNEFESSKVSASHVRVLADIWTESNTRHDTRWVTWAIANVTPVPARVGRVSTKGSLEVKLNEGVNNDDPWLESASIAAAVVGYMNRGPWSTRELIEVAYRSGFHAPEASLRLLRVMGVAGRRRADELKSQLGYVS